MKNETVMHFYNEIKFLAAEIGKLGLPDKFIEAAKAQNQEKIEEILDRSEAEYPKLWERLLKLYEKYEAEHEPKIFYHEEKDGYYVYNSEEINPRNLLFVLMFSEGNMTDTDVFFDWTILSDELLKAGYLELGKEANTASISSISYNLMRAYAK